MNASAVGTARRGAWSGLVLAAFLGALDQTIVATAGPSIMRALALEAGLYAWLTTAYLLTSTALVPVYGRLFDLYGRPRVALVGQALFLLGSAACGLSQSAAQLIAARALQGLGAASLFTAAFLAISDLFPPPARARAGGVLGAVLGLAAVVGPVLGGAVAEEAGWRWVFFVNLPLGAVAMAMTWPRGAATTPPHPRVPPRLDLPGVLWLALALVPLLVGLSQGRPAALHARTGWAWTSPLEVALFALAGVATLAFIAWERRQAEHALVDLRLLTGAAFRWGSAAVFSLGAVFLGLLVFVPLYMVNVAGVRAVSAGLTMTPLVLGVVVGNLVTGPLGRALPPARLFAGSLALLGLGLGLLRARLGAAPSQLELAGALVVVGLGLGPAIPLFTLALQGFAPTRRLGAATAFITFARQLGSTVGVALIGSVFASALMTTLSRQVEAVVDGLPTSVRARLDLGALQAEGPDAATPLGFDAERVKAAAVTRLTAARRLAQGALEGEWLATTVVASSALADPWLQETARLGGVASAVHAELAPVRAAFAQAAGDGRWAGRRALLEGVGGDAPSALALLLRPAPTRLEWLVATEALGAPAWEPWATPGAGEPLQTVLASAAPTPEALDAAFDHLEARLTSARLAAAAHRLDAQLDAARDALLPAIDAAERAVQTAFTQAMAPVYDLALAFAVLAALCTWRMLANWTMLTA